MNTKILGRIFSAFVLYLALLGGAVASSKSSMAELGNNTYRITREAKTTFTRDTEQLKSEAQADAARFCASRGKQMKVVTLTAEKPFMTLGYASATIVFRTFDPGDPELTRAPAPVAAAGAVSPEGAIGPTGEIAAGGGDVYSELLKLDDLRKRGILTDKEFQAEKKKILKRSH